MTNDENLYKSLIDTVKYVRSKYYSRNACFCDKVIINFIIKYNYETDGYDASFDVVQTRSIYLNDFKFMEDAFLPPKTLGIYYNGWADIDILTDEERNIKSIIE